MPLHRPALGLRALALYDYWARYYSPVLGRFVSADAVVPAGVQGLDRYAYAENNPLRYTDLSGHCVVGGHEYVFELFFEYRILPSFGDGQLVLRPDSVSIGSFTVDEAGYYSVARAPVEVSSGNVRAEGVISVGGTADWDTVGVLLSWEGLTEVDTPQGSYTFTQEVTERFEWHPRNGFGVAMVAASVIVPVVTGLPGPLPKLCVGYC